jgi:hypothetical protein
MSRGQTIDAAVRRGQLYTRRELAWSDDTRHRRGTSRGTNHGQEVRRRDTSIEALIRLSDLEVRQRVREVAS